MDEMRVTREVVLDTTAEELWELLTQQVELAGWLGREVQLDLVVGGVARVVEVDGIVRHGRVDVVDVGRRLGLTWWPDSDEGSASTVSFALTEEGQRTRLTVVETPVHGATGGGRCCALADAGTSWDRRLVDLELTLLARPVPFLATA